MKKQFILFSFLALSSGLIAQSQNAVATANGSNDVYYQLESSTKTEVPTNSWHLGFTLGTMDASIIINEANGVFAYEYSGTDWNAVDTTGMQWEPIYNSESSWSAGALANLGTFHPDYGWGTYNSSSHDINGTTIFIIQYGDAYKQVFVQKMSASGLFIVDVADIGGANTVTDTLTKADFPNQNFAYYHLENNAFVGLEPAKDEWELLFTKYYTPIPVGPGMFQEYLVSGIKTNKGWEVAQRNGVATSSNDTVGLTWSENITEIGYDWKTFNNSTFTYDITPDLTFFLREKGGSEVWKIYFTGYSGGEYQFMTEAVAGTASVNDLEMSMNVYPNPAKAFFVVESTSDEDEITVINSTGKQVFASRLTAGETQIDCHSWTPGLYVVQLKTNGWIRTKKIFIE